jgi:hypothetical protein
MAKLNKELLTEKEKEIYNSALWDAVNICRKNTQFRSEEQSSTSHSRIRNESIRGVEGEIIELLIRK